MNGSPPVLFRSERETTGGEYGQLLTERTTLETTPQTMAI